jgi:GrpB-like predicted nucleotidyltransferase (UPF0157 family)
MNQPGKRIHGVQMLKIVPYQATWPDEFRSIGSNLRQALSDLALRIDHIGSTSVPGLAAKDIIDIQITVANLDPDVEQALNRAGYLRIEGLTTDHLPPGSAVSTNDWTKWVFKPPAGQRATNVHVRLSGRANQRYALLFRDYFRAHPATAQAYAQVKEALVKYHADNVDAYYDIKDPVCDLIIGGAEVWAAATGWTAWSSDC